MNKPYRPGMALMPGESTSISIGILLPREMDGMSFQTTDISAQVYGKYQHCTLDKKSGLWYADSDYYGGNLRTALPSPDQDTPELTTLAKEMHRKAADKATARAIASTQPSWWSRFKAFLVS